MRFNRKLFKEAFKAGYKTAKRLNETSIEGTGKYNDFFKKLFDSFKDYEVFASLYDHNGKSIGGLWGVLFNMENPSVIELYNVGAPEEENSFAHTIEFRASDIIDIQPKVGFNIKFKNGKFIYLAVYEEVNANELDII